MTFQICFFKRWNYKDGGVFLAAVKHLEVSIGHVPDVEKLPLLVANFLWKV